MDPKLYKAAIMGDVEPLNEVNTQLLYSEAPHQQTALHIAARLGHDKFVRRMMELCRPLVRRQNSDEDTPLHCAARNGSVEVIKAMVDRAPSVDVERGDVMVLMRMRNGRGNTALHEALRWGHGAAAVKLVQGDPALSFAINNAGESALHLAAKLHLPRVIEEIFSLLSSMFLLHLSLFFTFFSIHSWVMKIRSAHLAGHIQHRDATQLMESVKTQPGYYGLAS